MLEVPRLPCILPRAFDAWAWSESDTLEWRSSRFEIDRERIIESSRDDGVRRIIDSTNPAGLVFVMREECTFLPRELARLHLLGWGLDGEYALAPYAIDDATDLLYERRQTPRDVFWLAADSLTALFWGLHDWVHFHNHGPFDEPAMTELQCDLVALAWLRLNRERIGIEDTTVDRLAGDLAELSRSRFAEEGGAPPWCDLDAVFRLGYASVVALAQRDLP
jgi:hypothetical protein